PGCLDDEPCLAICMMVCSCPEDRLWDDAQGCVEPPAMEILCTETGGELGCEPIDCPDDDPNCDAITVCNDWCYCPAGQAYDDLRG
ncbi:MAG: hypothetical protein QF464_01430, partial [Myxococcota bacterium]|nr:hypothetical protein [Myxococcota bacterium]